MKIILFAHQNWGVKTIETITKTNHQIIHVFTHPIDLDKNEKIWYESVEKECQKYDIPITIKANVNEEDEKKIQNASPDLILLVGWRKLIPQTIYKIPKYGTINMHDGLLPKYRGFAPINWAIVNGEKETGVTLHFVDKTADTGDIILQKKVSITLEDTASDVYNRILELVPELINELLNLVETKNFTIISQKGKKGFFCSRRFPKDGKINWNDDRIKIYNLIRGLSNPYPNAFCNYNKQTIFIKKAILIEEDYRGPPGRICQISDRGIIVTCGINHEQNQALLLTEIASEEKSYKPNEFFKKLWADLD